MKIKTAFIIFAILVLIFICIRSGTATAYQLPFSDKQISSAKTVPFPFLSCFGASDVDDCAVWNFDQPSTLRAKYIGGKEVEKISGMNLARQNEPVRAPFFQGEGLPTPPQQNAPWPHGADALSNAAATLFEQGLADPRGLEYREIEIAVGSPRNGGGYPLKTHGWILPNEGKEGLFAVAWNGLVYPVTSVGHSANL